MYEGLSHNQTLITPALHEAEHLLEKSQQGHKNIVVILDGMFDDRNAMILEREYFNTTGIGVVALAVPIQVTESTPFNEYEPITDPCKNMPHR
ncbi:hypothetical protein MRY82_02860 [bacterium]|nr:hypothetical protein [bacterium]